MRQAFFFLFFLGRVTLCSSDWCPAHYAPASACRVLGLQAWASSPGRYSTCTVWIIHGRSQHQGFISITCSPVCFPGNNNSAGSKIAWKYYHIDIHPLVACFPMGLSHRDRIHQHLILPGAISSQDWISELPLDMVQFACVCFWMYFLFHLCIISNYRIHSIRLI